jgi:2-polyprenyl-3-methyl-5-hydroxy-6-metoxy-1,4-benzoquinol methylase
VKHRRAPSGRPADIDLITRAASEVVPADDSMREWLGRYTRNHAERLAIDLQLVASTLESGGHVIEIGSAPFVLTRAMQRAGMAVTSIDLDPSRHADVIERWGLDVMAADIESPPWPVDAASADLMLFNEVLEHLRMNPVAALQEARRVLRPGGVLMLSTPNLLSLSGLSRLLLRGRAMAVGGSVAAEYAKLETLGHMGHVREYTFVEVRELLAHAGFVPEVAMFRGARGRPERLAGAVIPAAMPFVTFCCR